MNIFHAQVSASSVLIFTNYEPLLTLYLLKRSTLFYIRMISSHASRHCALSIVTFGSEGSNHLKAGSNHPRENATLSIVVHLGGFHNHI